MGKPMAEMAALPKHRACNAARSEAYLEILDTMLTTSKAATHLLLR